MWEPDPSKFIGRLVRFMPFRVPLAVRRGNANAIAKKPFGFSTLIDASAKFDV